MPPQGVMQFVREPDSEDLHRISALTANDSGCKHFRVLW